MALRPSSPPQHVVLPEPLASPLPHVSDPESDLARAVSPTVTCLLATVVTDPDLESTAAFALVTELVDFAARTRLDYVASLVTESEFVCPRSVRGELALGCDVLQDGQFELECLAAALPRQPSRGDLVASPTRLHWVVSCGYPVEPPAASLRSPPGAPRVVRHTEDYTCGSWFAPSSADPSLFLRTDTTMPPFYVLVYVDDLVFATADTEALALVKSELQGRYICTDLGELRSSLGLQITRDGARRTITLTQSHMVHQVLQRFAFHFSSPQPTPLSTGHSLSAPPSDESIEPSGPYPELLGCLMYLMTCTRPDLAYPLSLLACYVASGRHRKVHWDAAKRVLRYLCSTSGIGLVLGGQGSVILTGQPDASWADDQATQRSSQGYTFSLGSGSISWSPEQRLEHRTKHIALRYFLARELQQRRQLRLSYVDSQANTADVFTKALGSGDHQRFRTALGLVPTLPHLLVA
ncbi:unnamed protein product [Closterium sp. NIES-53]